MVIWTPRARNDLKTIYDHIHKDSPINAKNITQKILAKTANLKEFPGTHKAVSEAKINNIHEVSVSAWRVIYHPRDHDIHIITIVHKRQILKDSMIQY